MRIIGIDLGTTNSAACWWDGDEPRIIPNDRGKNLTPSVVAFDESGEVLVGESAHNQAVVNSERTILGVKRLMGTDSTYTIGGSNYSPEYISSLILSKIKADAEHYLGESVKAAVVTVPAHFTEAQRQATIHAGELAGLDVRRILNEPTAAALSHASRVKGTNRLLVYDLGGGTFDATCLLQEGETFTVKSTIGDNRLGGVDFDDILLEQVLHAFEHDSGVNLRGEPALVQQLRDGVERAKIELSSRESAEVAMPFIGTGGKPVHLRKQLTREDFSRSIEQLLKKTIKLTLTAVREAGFGISGIDGLIVSGGSSRIPLVHTYLRRALGLSEVRMLNPDETVALGAGVQAGIIERGGDDIRVTDVTSKTLGVEAQGGDFVPIIDRNTPIPVRRRRMFTTVSDNQRAVEIHVLQGEAEQPEHNSSLGRFLLAGIRETIRGGARIELGFSVDKDGLVHVDARDVDTGAAHSVELQQSEKPAAGGPGVESDELRGLRSRVQMYFDALRSTLDKDFAAEVQHFLKIADDVLEHSDESRREETRVALNALADELAAWLEAGEVKDAGA